MRLLIYTGWPVKSWQIPDAHVARIRRELPTDNILHATNADEAARDIVDADAGLIPWLTPALLDKATKISWIHSSAVAVGDLLPLAALAQRGVTVTNSRGVQSIPMAEQVMAGLLALARRLDLSLAAQRDRRWIQSQLGEIVRPWTLHGKSMTIIGLGSIGLAVAERAHAFGMRITGVRRRPELDAPRFVDKVVGPDRLDEALDGSEVVVIAAPSVAATARLMDRGRIARLARGAILVNVARAQLVDTNAMIEALEHGQLGGAVLDVFDREPLDESSPLWSMANVIVTPHSAGFRANHWDEVVNVFLENVSRFKRAQPPRNLVDPIAGY